MTSLRTSVVALSLMVSFSSSIGEAALDPLTGVRVALTATQTLLAAPPLPSLDEKGGALSVQATRLTAEVSGTSADVDSYSGKLAGGALGLGYSTGNSSAIGFNMIANFSQMSGEMQIGDGTDPNSKFKNFTTTGAVVTANLHARLIGDEKSVIAFGVLGGPAAMKFDSRFEIGPWSYESNPLIYGGFGGAQLRIRIGWLAINPYVVAFQEASNKCKKLTSSAGTISAPTPCNGDHSALKLNASFTAYGLMLGYKKFLVNVYSKLLQSDSQLSDTSIHQISLSYTF